MGVTDAGKFVPDSLAGLFFFLETAREKRADSFFLAFCAPPDFFIEAFLFAFFNGDVIDLYSGCVDVAWIARRNGHQDVQPLDNLTKDAMSIVKMRSRGVCNKELRAVCARTSIGHGYHALLIVSQAGVKFITELIARSARATSGWVTALRHEI